MKFLDTFVHLCPDELFQLLCIHPSRAVDVHGMKNANVCNAAIELHSLVVEEMAHFNGYRDDWHLCVVRDLEAADSELGELCRSLCASFWNEWKEAGKNRCKSRALE